MNKGVIITGPQKSGTHLLWCLVQMLGYKPHKEYWHRDCNLGEVPPDVSVHSHLIYDKKSLVSNAKFMVIVRDPRNIIVSRARVIYPDMKLNIAVLKTLADDACWKYNPRLMLDWVGWLTDSDALVSKFEDIISKPHPKLAAIGYWLNAKIKTINNPLGRTPTWSGKNSCWQDIWDEKIDKRFDECGGYDVIKAFGYVA